MNQLYYGDNLPVLREHLADESVDLIYLDPPFNSKRDYNLLFKSPKGQQSEAQIEAFEDTWHWNEQAERELAEITDKKQANVQLKEVMLALRRFLGDNDMLAYLTMMANRLLQLHRVLKPTGSLYLHCDPTASHYLKVVLDGVFGKDNYRNEISWKRSQPKSHATVNFPNCRDIIFRYAKTETVKFNKVYGQHDPDYIEKFYRFADKDGRRYRLGDITNPNKNRPNLTYEFLGVTRVWRWTKDRMQKANEDGLIYQAKPGAVPQERRYLDEMTGQPISDDWDDIEHLHGGVRPDVVGESLGYPTQKPLALLERIIQASSDEGDVVLDPFCGCGTAVHAAQKLRRKWIGIDITHLAISLIEKRLKDAFGKRCKYEVHGTPKDLDSARDLARRDKYQFQWWAVSLVEAQPSQGKKKGADAGIDGVKYFRDLDNKDLRKIVVSVKGGENLKADDVRSLTAVREHAGADIALFISLEEPTKGMVKDAAASGFYESPNGKKYTRVQLLTIRDLLSGTARAEHPDYEPDLNFKKAKVEADASQKDLI